MDKHVLEETCSDCRRNGAHCDCRRRCGQCSVVNLVLLKRHAEEEVKGKVYLLQGSKLPVELCDLIFVVALQIEGIS